MKLVFLVVFLEISSSFAQSTCTTPNGETAQCISIYSCPTILNALQDITPDSMAFLKQSQCGYKNGPLVCCGSVSSSQQSSRFQELSNRKQFVVNKKPDLKHHRNFNLLPSRGYCGQQSQQDRIVGGNLTGIDEFPWMALMEYRQNGRSSGHQCGGMLIRDNYVLTAAHCVTGEAQTYFGELYRVRLGEYDRGSSQDCIEFEGENSKFCAPPVQDIDVEEIFVHPDYFPDEKAQYNDIALLRLKNSVQLTEFAYPICLPINEEETPTGKNLVVAGWGRTEKVRTSRFKLKASLPRVSEKECKSIYDPLGIDLKEEQFCAGGLSGIDSCQGDSGGPLMTRFPKDIYWYVEGIVSFGPTFCGSKNYPGIYTKISKYIDWILDNMTP